MMPLTVILCSSVAYHGDNLERQIPYISRALTPARKNYSQLEKEGLSIIFAVKKFHAYILGHQFMIELDYQPLRSLF